MCLPSFSFFVGELEKCLEDNEHLPELFIKHVSGTLMMMRVIINHHDEDGIAFDLE